MAKFPVKNPVLDFTANYKVGDVVRVRVGKEKRFAEGRLVTIGKITKANIVSDTPNPKTGKPVYVNQNDVLELVSSAAVETAPAEVVVAAAQVAAVEGASA